MREEYFIVARGMKWDFVHTMGYFLPWSGNAVASAHRHNVSFATGCFIGPPVQIRIFRCYPADGFMVLQSLRYCRPATRLFQRETWTL